MITAFNPESAPRETEGWKASGAHLAELHDFHHRLDALVTTKLQHLLQVIMSTATACQAQQPVKHNSLMQHHQHQAHAERRAHAVTCKFKLSCRLRVTASEVAPVSWCGMHVDRPLVTLNCGAPAVRQTDCNYMKPACISGTNEDEQHGGASSYHSMVLHDAAWCCT
jgi:hypothetical protein